MHADGKNGETVLLYSNNANTTPCCAKFRLGFTAGLAEDTLNFRLYLGV